MTETKVIDVLHTPIQINEIEWRIASTKNGKTQILAYITNRCVMERLDMAFGWDGWQVEHTQVNGGFICKLSVFSEEYDIWISKTDGADSSKIEPFKGGISDSMKRVAVQYGLGRGLYDYPTTYIEGEHRYIPKWAYPRLKAMVNAINNPEQGKEIPNVVIIKEK